MSVEAVKAVVNGPRSIKGARYNVLTALAEWADKDGIVISRDGERLYVDHISEQAHCSERTAQRAFKWLEEEGYLSIERGRGAGIESAYKVNIAELYRRRAQEDRGKGDNVTPFNRNKGDKMTPFLQVKGDNVTPIRAERGVNLSPVEAGIKEPYLSTIEEREDERMDDDDGERARRATSPASSFAPASPVPSGLRGSALSGANGAHSPPEAQPGGLGCVVTDAMIASAEAMAGEHGVELYGSLFADYFQGYYQRGRGKSFATDDWPGKWDEWVHNEIGKIKKGSSNYGRVSEQSGVNVVPGGEPNGRGGRRAARGDEAAQSKAQLEQAIAALEADRQGVQSGRPGTPGRPGP